MIMGIHRIRAFKCCCCGWYVQITSMHYVHGEPTSIKCGTHAFYLSSMLLGFSIFTTKVRCICVCVFVFQFSNWICLWFVCSMFGHDCVLKIWTHWIWVGFFFSLLLAKYSELANFFLSKWLKRCFSFWFSGHQIS